MFHRCHHIFNGNFKGDIAQSTCGISEVYELIPGMTHVMVNLCLLRLNLIYWGPFSLPPQQLYLSIVPADMSVQTHVLPPVYHPLITYSYPPSLYLVPYYSALCCAFLSKLQICRSRYHHLGN